MDHCLHLVLIVKNVYDMIYTANCVTKVICLLYNINGFKQNEHRFSNCFYVLNLVPFIGNKRH